MIQLIIKVCVDCDQPIDQCKFQRNLRALNLDKFADFLTEEREVGACSSSKSHGK